MNKKEKEKLDDFEYLYTIAHLVEIRVLTTDEAADAIRGSIYSDLFCARWERDKQKQLANAIGYL